MNTNAHQQPPVDLFTGSSTSSSPPSLPTSTSSNSTQLPPLLRLPPEILSHILSHVPPQSYQRTALALHKVFPGYGLAEEHLWRHLQVKKGEQLMPLWKAARARRDRMKERVDVDEREDRSRRAERGWNSYDEEGKGDGDEHELDEEDEDEGPGYNLRLGKRLGVNSFAMESWRGDADLLNNALRCLPHVPVMRLNLGTNFAPEHLEEMFQDPRLGLERLELRFRPYVEQASYYQFLKGSYFDTAIETLTRQWPEVPSFKRLSVVQDLPPRSTAPPTAAHSIAPSALTSMAGTAIGSTVTSATPSAVSSPIVNPARLGDQVSLLSLSDTKPGSVVKQPTELDGDPARPTDQNDQSTHDVDSSSDSESSDHSTPPTSLASESPVEPRGYTGHGPFPYLSEKIGWAKPKHFAQPIVFFDIHCLAKFGLSPSARHLTHLRLRVPSRDIAAVLCGPAGSHQPLFPSLTYLDISTTNVRLDTTLATLLKRYEQLEHLVLDRVNLFGFQARDKGSEMSRDLGGMPPSACLARGKERERAIVSWDTAERARIARAAAEAARAANLSSTGSANDSLIDQAQREARAAAEERERALQIARSRRGHRSAAQSTFSLRDRPSRLRSTSLASASASGIAIGPLPPSDKLYLVLPPLPSLKTIGIGGEAQHVSSAKVREWTVEFQNGWRDGLGKLMGWAGHVADRYERARKKADEWNAQESRNLMVNQSGSGTGGAGGKGKGKVKPTAKPATVSKPPTDVRLFRHPYPAEQVALGPTRLNPMDPLDGLIEINPVAREYLDPYRDAMAEAELHANDYSHPPACLICTVPDCEGPRRRGDEGGRVDGRGGMEGVHVPGCGHLVGRENWGWAGC